MVKAYLVGGYVRDKLLGVKSKDIDYSVEARDYDEMVAWIRERGQIYLEQPDYWTVRAHLKGKFPADYVLCRRDGQYHDGRRPSTVEAGTLLDDLARRDFTVNAIAMDEETGEYIDPHGGREDLKHGLLRCVGTPQERFHEDALRMLRAIRFRITKGFRLEMGVTNALEDEGLCERLATNVSDERKREELLKCFAHDTVESIRLLQVFERLAKACFSSGKLWLLPTMRDA